MEIKFEQTENYTKSTGIKKIGFVLHGTLGGYQGSINWLKTIPSKRPDGSSSSAHYVIGRNKGEVTQLVKNEDISWHAGNISNPSERAKKSIPKKLFGLFDNPNNYFIGIEFCWGYDTDNDGDIDAIDKTLTDWQYECCVEIIKKSGIIYNEDNILSHQEIASYKSDNMLFAIPIISKLMKPAENKEDIKKQIISLVAKL